ncbi:MAG: hypothetical protein ACK54V_06745 [Candidatus Kapaibacterium sp.]|jgi:hypothetical protein
MPSIKIVFAILVLIAVGAVSLLFVPSPRSHISMRLVDRFDQTSVDGQRSILAIVEVDGTDSLLFREYANTMYHALVPDSVGASMPVQLITYFYHPENLRELHPMQILQMSGGDKKRFALLKNLSSDSAGYFAIRYSDIYQLMQRDTLYVQSGNLVVPGNGTQLKDFFSPTSMREK